MRTVRKFLATMLLLLFVVGSAFAQNISGKINGTIVTSDGTAAEAVSVQIKQSNKGAVTDAKGYFEFRKLKAGSYVLTVSITGYQPMEETVVVEADKTATVSFKLTASQKELTAVIVTAGSNKFGKKESDYVARLPLKNVENPQVYNVVGKELLQEQVVTSFDDAVKNAPGVNKLWTSTGRGGDGAGDLADAADGRGDAVDRIHRQFRGALDGADLRGDLLGGLRRLGGQRLALGFAHGDGLAVADEGELAHLHLVAELLRLGFGEADGGDLGGAVGAAGDVAGVHRRHAPPPPLRVPEHRTGPALRAWTPAGGARAS
eukprot:gene5032-6823_t